MSSKPQQKTTSSEMRALKLLRNPKNWITPTVITSIVIALMTLIYFGAIVNPTSHLRGLPVTVVNEDAGSSSPSGPINIGDQVVSAGFDFEDRSHAVAKMDVAGAQEEEHSCRIGRGYGSAEQE